MDSSLNFPSTDSWRDWQLFEVEVPLLEGDNLIRITAIGQSGGNFDSLAIGGENPITTDKTIKIIKIEALGASPSQPSPLTEDLN